MRNDTFDTPPHLLELLPGVLVVAIVPPGSLVPCCCWWCWCHCLGHWKRRHLHGVQGLKGFRLHHYKGTNKVGEGARVTGTPAVSRIVAFKGTATTGSCRG